MSTTFVDLCPDILFHLFTYFSLNELFKTFIDLIPYLPTLLRQGRLKLYINKNTDKNFWKDFLPRINHQQIIALNISYVQINEINLFEFSSLRSIIFEDFRMINSHSLYPINQLNNFIYLERLELKLSDTILNENIWLSHIIQLPNIKQLKIDLMIEKNTIVSQRDIQISQLPFKSLTIKYLQIKIPLLWSSIISLLHHFPLLQTFHAFLYRINSNHNDILLSKPNLSCFQSLKILYLTGYFASMSSVITYFCSSILNLKICRLMSTSATNDNIIHMIKLRQNFFWTHLFQSCQYLTQVKIHILIAIESQKNIDLDNLKELIRAFNNYTFCRQYKLYVIQTSMRNGYLTLLCDFNKRLV